MRAGLRTLDAHARQLLASAALPTRRNDAGQGQGADVCARTCKRRDI